MGGSTLEAENVLAEFAQAIELVPRETDIVIVHGGGRDIARQLKRLGKGDSFIEGLRVTDSEVIDVVEGVLSGLVNKWIARALGKRGLSAAGISGTDHDLFHAEKMIVKSGDLGYVGSIKRVNTEMIEILLSHHIIPVVSPISIGPGYCAYNVNADHAASMLAEAWRADDLIFITDVPGILVDGELRTSIRIDEVDSLIGECHVTGGMIPKLMNAATAVREGVGRVHIIGWKGPESIVDSMDEQKHWGTVIY